jgi:hypothetical protein
MTNPGRRSRRRDNLPPDMTVLVVSLARNSLTRLRLVTGAFLGACEHVWSLAS